MKIGLIGGTFDPPHIAHLVGARRALEQLKLDKVIFVPNNIPPHKPQAVASQSQRLEMVKLAVEYEKNFEVSDFEIQKGGVSYTVETVEHFYKKGYEIFLLIGQDSLVNFHTWKEYEKILQMCKLGWFPRMNENSKTEKKINQKVLEKSIRINSEIIEVSSSRIREYIKKGISIRWIVPDKVIEYINQKQLYK
ncbi:MAG: nicotinate (nicotinamide) nucleotide adenylyltransferase [Candidatus Calescibacterium sp.]|nr:nicotinate (nicotinamide) nucleotide adenylyltransferase [Candidatus Calescibacterium sp.]MCX7733372.1 nicotinate (nicotinamide) nucleotide adenylyltransferase [bacterium]MDW8087486.1 nicotinate (nicotinamide) nucleotide adenylyltransferase [Candidatus Calescibacterium sp.]